MVRGIDTSTLCHWGEINGNTNWPRARYERVPKKSIQFALVARRRFLEKVVKEIANDVEEFLWSQTARIYQAYGRCCCAAKRRLSYSQWSSPMKQLIEGRNGMTRTDVIRTLEGNDVTLRFSWSFQRMMSRLGEDLLESLSP